MLDAMVDNSRQLAEERERSFRLKTRMDQAARGQNPHILMVSPIHMSGHDCSLLGLGQGDAFWATRLPKTSLLSSDESPFFFGGPAAYFGHIGGTALAVITFESDESDDVVQESMSALAQNEHLRKSHILGLQLDSEGMYRPVGEVKFTDRLIAGILARRSVTTPETDERVLVILCSDSRLLPPNTSTGVPMTIRTIGGFIPPCDDASRETQDLDDFLAGWLEDNTSEKRKVIIAHGHTTGEAAVCGAAKASLNPSELTDELLRLIVERIGDDARRVDSAYDATPYDRAIAIAKATKQNLATYSAVHELEKRRLLPSKFIQLAFMDTVTGLLAPL
jgi:carbonic anhydrase